MRDRIHELNERNLRLVLIATGSVEQARGFRGEIPEGSVLLVDPEMVGYRAAELERSLFAVYHPRTTFSFFKALRRGFRPGPVQGDVAQLGGMFVICPEAGNIYSHVAKSIADRPQIDDVFAEIDPVLLK